MYVCLNSSSCPTKILCTLIICPMHAKWYTHLILVFNQCNAINDPVTSSLLDPSIHCGTLVANALNVCSSLTVREISHSCKTISETVGITEL